MPGSFASSPPVIMREGGIGDKHARAVGVGLTACLVFFARDNAGYHIRFVGDPDRLPRHIVAAKQRPGELLVEHDAVIRKVAVRDIAARTKRQRMEQEEVPADADGLGRVGDGICGDGDVLRCG